MPLANGQIFQGQYVAIPGLFYLYGEVAILLLLRPGFRVWLKCRLRRKTKQRGHAVRHRLEPCSATTGAEITLRSCVFGNTAPEVVSYVKVK